MIQKMRNQLVVNVPGEDMNTMTNIEVTIEQEENNLEFTYSGDSIAVSAAGKVLVSIPKEDADQLNFENDVRGQVMFTRPTGFPDATRIFRIPVRELLKEGGYGN